MPRFAELILCWAVLISTVAIAQDEPRVAENPLQFFPAETALVLRLREPDKTKDAFTNFVNAVQPGAGQFMGQADQQLGKLISNPDLTGVDQSRDWYVGVVLSEVGRPVPVFAIPSTDPAALVDAVDEQMNTAVQGTWVLYTEKPAELPQVSGDSITTLLSGPAFELFQKAEVGAFLNMAHLTKTYADQIDQAKDQVSTALNQLQAASPPGMDMTAIVNLYSEIAIQFFQALDDSSHLTLTVAVNETGIQFEDYLVVQEGSETDKFLAAHPPVAMPALEKLPKGQQAYFGMTGSSDMMKWGLELTKTMFSQSPGLQDLDGTIAKLAESRLDSMVGAFSMQDQLSSISVMQGELQPSFKDAMRELQTKMQSIESPLLKQTATLQPDAENVGELTVDIITIRQEFADNPVADPLGLQKAIQERMFGPEGMQSRLVYEPQRLVQVVGDLATLEKTLKSLDGERTNGLDRGQLPQQANILGLMNLPMFYGEILKAIGSVEGFPLQVDPSVVDNLNLPQSYVGAAVVSESHAGRLRIEIPVSQIQGLIKLGTTVALAIQQAQQQQQN